MKLGLLIIDDFYENPEFVREFALKQEFSVFGNYPGKRTKSFLETSIKDAIQSFMPKEYGKVVQWHDYDGEGYSGAFQSCTSKDRTWIHVDHKNMWSGVCFLSPDAPLTGGTGLFRHKETKFNWSDSDTLPNNQPYDPYDYTKFELVDRIGNVFNRLILYPGNLFHASLDYFGDNLETGRLFQTFFFDTEKSPI